MSGEIIYDEKTEMPDWERWKKKLEFID